MKIFAKTPILKMVLMSLFTVPIVEAKTPRVDKRISNMYQQVFKNENFAYLVDPFAQLCFVRSFQGGIQEIDCKSLKKRQEWRGIIYWEEG